MSCVASQPRRSALHVKTFTEGADVPDRRSHLATPTTTKSADFVGGPKCDRRDCSDASTPLSGPRSASVAAASSYWDRALIWDLDRSSTPAGKGLHFCDAHSISFALADGCRMCCIEALSPDADHRARPLAQTLPRIGMAAEAVAVGKLKSPSGSKVLSKFFFSRKDQSPSTPVNRHHGQHDERHHKEQGREEAENEYGAYESYGRPRSSSMATLAIATTLPTTSRRKSFRRRFSDSLKRSTPFLTSPFASISSSSSSSSPSSSSSASASSSAPTSQAALRSSTVSCSIITPNGDSGQAANPRGKKTLSLSSLSLYSAGAASSSASSSSSSSSSTSSSSTSFPTASKQGPRSSAKKISSPIITTIPPGSTEESGRRSWQEDAIIDEVVSMYNSSSS